MKRQKILSLNQNQNIITFKIEKNNSYLNFITKLLKKYNINKKNSEINHKKDTHNIYLSEKVRIFEFIGDKAIFLMIITDYKEKLIKILKKETYFGKEIINYKFLK